MSFSTQYRNLSPSGGRHHVAGPRASTGMVQLGSSVDPYEPPRRHYEHEDYPSDAGYGSAYRHYPIRRSPVEARPVSMQKVRDSGHSTKRTEYTIEPQPRHRSRSNTASAVDIYHNSAHLSVPSYIHSAHSVHGRDLSPLPTDSSHYVMPAHHGGHRRLHSTEYASDTGHLDSHDRTKHRSSRHGSQHGPPPSGRRQYPAYDDIKKGEDIDKYHAYSYTTPREQFDRDYPVQPRHPTGRNSLDRPMSMIVMDDEHSQRVPRKERPHGPPPTSWGMDKLDRDGRSRTVRADDHRRDGSRSRGHDRSLVTVPHLSDDDHDSYSDSHRRHRRHRRSHHEIARDRHDDRSPRPHHDGESERALVGLGTAALGNGYTDMSDYDQRPSRQHRRPREPERDYQPPQSTSRELVEGTPSPERQQLYLEPGDHHRSQRSRSHRRSHSRRRNGDESDWPTDDEDLRKYQREPSAAPRRKHSSEDTSEDNKATRGHRRPRERSHVRSRSRSISNDSKDGGKKVVAVDPPAQKEPDTMPKGILKKPRPAFPEEPNPVREGVAPLSKDADKHGIPPGARWTKIDRRLVNPTALKLEGIRFEERPDYVIVLKVLSKEDIQKLALATQLIRDARHKEYVRDKRQHRDEHQRNGHHNDSTSSDDEDENDEPLKIEAAPGTESQRQHLSLPERPPSSSHSVHENAKMRMSPSAAPA
ncbi:hypothetical protein N7486_008078 [Penicillium sp. IBT 16267x]|nr:hypothetical protein N7486_008078 [Penicillium sp. IBT 16267x]